MPSLIFLNILCFKKNKYRFLNAHSVEARLKGENEDYASPDLSGFLVLKLPYFLKKQLIDQIKAITVFASAPNWGLFNYTDTFGFFPPRSYLGWGRHLSFCHGFWWHVTRAADRGGALSGKVCWRQRGRWCFHFAITFAPWTIQVGARPWGTQETNLTHVN